MVRLKASVKSFIARVRKAYSPQIILLFGSRAKGTARHDSDYDFLIVADSFRFLRPIERPQRIHELHKGEFALEVICLTPQEFEKLKDKPTIVHEAVQDGVIAYAEAGV